MSGDTTLGGASISELTSTAQEAGERRREKQAWLDSPKAKMRSYAHEVASEHDMDIDWVSFSMRVSQRTKRHGAFTVETTRISDPFSERSATQTEAEMDVSINVLKNHGVDKFKETIRHELIHVWQYQHDREMGHGASFEEWADKLDTSQYADHRADGC